MSDTEGLKMSVESLISRADKWQARAEAAEAELALYRLATKPVDDLPWRGWHFANVKVRINGEFKEFEGDWLKVLAYLRCGRHDIVRRYFPEASDD